MKKIFFLCLLISTTNTAKANNSIIKASINGMVCAFCAQGIEKKIRALPEAKNVYVSLQQKIVAVEINDGKTLTPETITTVVNDAGYSVTKIEMLDTTIEQIKTDAAATKKAKP
jgi:periplasmic mercuric ion binding protein